MWKRLGTIVVFFLAFGFLYIPFARAIPPKPGPRYIWVKPHKALHGRRIPGHWKYIGPGKPDAVWIPGHFNAYRGWVDGHWKTIPVKRGQVYVPGHYGHRGHWIPGHWK